MTTATQIARCFCFSDSQAGALIRLAGSVRSVNPAGAATIFALAYLAGLAGSLVAALVVLALLAGLHLARVASLPAVESTAPPMAPPIADIQAVEVFGLPVKTITFAKQAEPRKPRAKQAGEFSYSRGQADGYYRCKKASDNADYLLGYAEGAAMVDREFSKTA